MSLLDWILGFCALLTVELTIFGSYLGLSVKVAKLGVTAQDAKDSAANAHKRIDGLLGFRNAKT